MKTAVEVRTFRRPEKIPEDILRQGCVRPKELRGLGMTGKVVGVRFEDMVRKVDTNNLYQAQNFN